jgi:hypothetical protein
MNPTTYTPTSMQDAVDFMFRRTLRNRPYMTDSYWDQVVPIHGLAWENAATQTLPAAKTATGKIDWAAIIAAIEAGISVLIPGAGPMIEEIIALLESIFAPTTPPIPAA